jgi:hypothetical protein
MDRQHRLHAVRATTHRLRLLYPKGTYGALDSSFPPFPSISSEGTGIFQLVPKENSTTATSSAARRILSHNPGNSYGRPTVFSSLGSSSCV